MRILSSIIFLLVSFFALAQISPKDSLQLEKFATDSIKTGKTKTQKEVISDIEKVNAPFSAPKFNPTRAGLYSAILPGLGQYYNKKYWKIPIVWAAIGTGVGFTIYYNNQYKRYRNDFVAELNGVPHEFSDKPWITKEVLGNYQDSMKRYRDYAIAITSLVYILNIIDAVVDAQLYEGRHDPDLALQPTLLYEGFGNSTAKVGFSLHYNF